MLADEAALTDLDVVDPGTGFPSVAERRTEGFFAARDPEDTLVAEVSGRLAGYLTLTHPTSLPENAHVWMIHGFRVAPEFRGQGLGRALLDEAGRTVRARGGRKLSLRVLASNRRARAVYAAAGFVVEGVLGQEFTIDGVPVDDLLFARYLWIARSAAGSERLPVRTAQARFARRVRAPPAAGPGTMDGPVFPAGGRLVRG